MRQNYRTRLIFVFSFAFLICGCDSSIESDYVVSDLNPGEYISFTLANVSSHNNEELVLWLTVPPGDGIQCAKTFQAPAPGKKQLFKYYCKNLSYLKEGTPIRSHLGRVKDNPKVAAVAEHITPDEKSNNN